MYAPSTSATDGSTWNSATLAYPYFSASDFHEACDIQSSDYNSASGRSNVQTCRLSGMPDLNSESSYVRGQVVNYRSLADGRQVYLVTSRRVTEAELRLGAEKVRITVDGDAVRAGTAADPAQGADG